MLAFCLTHGKIYSSEGLHQDLHAKLLKGCLLYSFFFFSWADIIGLFKWGGVAYVRVPFAQEVGCSVPPVYWALSPD